MRKGIMMVLVLGLMVFGFAAVSGAQAGPVLDKIWAPAEVNVGSVLKIYFKASDPEGDMRWVTVSAMKTGQTEPAGSVMIRLKKDFRKEVNGFLYWDTTKAATTNTEGTVILQVEDFKGQESAPMSVKIKLVPKGAKAEKAPAEFKDVPIGPIMMGAIERPY